MSGFDYSFFLEVLIGGLLSGVMYSLVAIGFVLIYKTSGVLNFAQGAMVLFAALTFVGILEHGVPFFASLAVTLVIMAVLGIAVERAVLQPLVNKPPITLFMATLGLAYILEGGAQLIWGAQVHGLNLGFDDTPFSVGDVLISSFDLFAAAVAAAMVILLSAFFRFTHTGLAVRAGAGRAAATGHLGNCMDGRRRRCAGCRAPLGCPLGRSVLAVPDRFEGAARTRSWRLRFDLGGDRRRITGGRD